MPSPSPDSLLHQIIKARERITAATPGQLRLRLVIGEVQEEQLEAELKAAAGPLFAGCMEFLGMEVQHAGKGCAAFLITGAPWGTGVLPNVCCRSCSQQLSWEIDRAGMQLSKRVITCKSHGCPQAGVRYNVPTVELEPA